MLKILGSVITILALFVIGTSFIQAFNLPKSIERGKEAYVLYCQNCHMEDGKGQEGLYPPVAKADFLKKPNKVLINVILKGQNGEVTVNGIKYNAEMPAQNYLTDEQIADILNYTKNAWGNKSAIAITPAMVKQIRQ